MGWLQPTSHGGARLEVQPLPKNTGRQTDNGSCSLQTNE